MALELNDLRSFLVLSEQLHFGRAAEILHVSQPALSKQIRRFSFSQTKAKLICRSISLNRWFSGT
jgi:DNA-binding transcriptional LysR family regulator